MAKNTAEIVDFCEKAAHSQSEKTLEPIRVTYAKSRAVELCTAFLKDNYPPSKQPITQIVCNTGATLMAEARWRGIVDKHGDIDFQNKYELYKLDLYDLDGNKSEQLFADLEPITVEQDHRLREGSRSSMFIPADLYEDLSLLRTIYRLRSDGDVIVHLIIVAATLLRLEMVHSLYCGTKLGLGIKKTQSSANAVSRIPPVTAS